MQMKAETAMKRLLVLSFWIAGTTTANGQKLSADKLIDMLSLSEIKSESLLLHKNYHVAGTEISGDTVIKTFACNPVIRFSKKKHADTASRKIIRFVLKETFIISYRTTSAVEYSSIIRSLKKKGFYCEYENDSTVTPGSYFYQYEDHTADASVNRVADTAWYSISFHKKIFPVDRELHFAEDLLQFTSHEYLVYYFGEKNVEKDFYYFGENDIVKCSVY